MAGENFLDNVQYGTDGVLRVSSVIGISNTSGVLALAANPSTDQTVNFPDASGTLLLSGSAIQGFGVSTGGNTAGNTGTTVGTVVLAAVGNLTLSQSTAAGSLATISFSAGTAAAATVVSAFGISNLGNTSGTSGTQTGTIVLAGGNNIVVSQSTNTNGATITISGQNAIEAAGISNLAGNNTSGTSGTVTGTLVLAGGNNIVVSQSTNANGATITISGSNAIEAAGISNLAGNHTSGTSGTVTGTLVLAGGNNIVVSQSTNANGATITISASDAIEAAGISNLGNTSGTSGSQTGTLVFAGGNNITLSQSTNTNGATITISGANETQTFIGGIAAGTQTATSGTVVLSNSNNVSFGMSNSSVVTATVENRLTAFQWPQPFHDTNFSISNATLSLQKIFMPMHHTATRMLAIFNLTGASNSTGALTWSAAVYTLSGSTASLASSASRQISWTSGSATTASSVYGGVSGTQYQTLAINLTMTPGDYLFAHHFRTTNNGTWAIFGKNAVSIVNALDANQTNYWLDGTSVSSFTTAFPNSINVTDTNYARTGAAALRQPGFVLVGTF